MFKCLLCLGPRFPSIPLNSFRVPPLHFLGRLVRGLPVFLLFSKNQNLVSLVTHGTPHQHSCLENPRDGGAWWATVHGVASQIRLSVFTCTFHFHALEKEMATHSSVLAWRVPGTGEPGGLPSTGSHGVGHD